MSAAPRQPRERLTRTVLLARIASIKQQATALEQGLAQFAVGTELANEIQPSV